MSSDRSMRYNALTWAQVDKLVDMLVPRLKTAGYFDALVLVTRGGIIPGGLISEALGLNYVLTAAVRFPPEPEGAAQLAVLPEFLQFPDDALIHKRRTLIIDDVWGSGRTSTAVKSRCYTAGAIPFTCVFHFNPYRSLFSRAEPDFYAAITDVHIVYPWELDRGTDDVLIGSPETN